MTDEQRPALDGTTRAAILLLTVGERLASEVLKHLDTREMQQIGGMIARLKTVARKDVSATLEAFISQAMERTPLPIGTEEYLMNSLSKTMGKDRARDFVNHILSGERVWGMDAVRRMDSPAVAAMLRQEHPQIAAIVLANLKPDHAAEVLALFPDAQRPELVTRVATMESLPPEALTELDALIDQKVSSSPGLHSSRVGGLKAAVSMLNSLDQSAGVEILNHIREGNPTLGDSLDDAMFTFDDLVELADRDIQMILKNLSHEVLVKALKAGDEEVKEKIFRNMSKRAAQLIHDDLEGTGPVRLADVEQAQKEIIRIARQMADKGEINLGSSEEYV